MEIPSQEIRSWGILVHVPQEQKSPLSYPHCPTHINRVGKLHEIWERHATKEEKVCMVLIF